MKITGDVISHGGKNETYEEFVSKHKTKKTTDDCYTPPDVYEAVKAFFMKEFGIPEDAVIERPFYPGGDYKSYQYTEKSVVIDNPPFSIMKDIVSFYDSSGIPYVLFCPSLTLPTYTKGGLLITSEYITYENGAKVADMEDLRLETLLDPYYKWICTNVHHVDYSEDEIKHDHLFRIKPSEGVKEGEVRVTDCFGKTYIRKVSW